MPSDDAFGGEKRRKIDPVIKPTSDPKQYRTFFLENGLRCTLVGDPRPEAVTKEIGVAISVGVGSFSDPKDRQGLAHLLEHIILMGNEKYPVENSLDDFLEKTGGYSNAYTECEQTFFYMSVLPDHIDQALDRFANVFVKPLLRADFFIVKSTLWTASSSCYSKGCRALPASILKILYRLLREFLMG